MSWVDAMALGGLEVWITPEEHVGVADRSSGWRTGPVPLRRRARYLRSGDIGGLAAGDRALVVAERATKGALALLTAARVAWALDDGRYHVDPRHHRAAPLQGERPARRRGDPRAALALLLTARPHLSQRALGGALGISQPRVHRLLRDLAEAGVDRSAEDDLLRVWHHGRHNPPGEVQHWLADAPVWDQVAHAYTELDAAGHRPVVGGEPAADRLVAWTTPATAVVHAKGLRPLPAPFMPTPHPDESTLAVVATRDPLLHALACDADTPAGRLRIAHPALVARDLAPQARVDERVAETAQRLSSAPSTGQGEHAHG